MFFKTKKVIDKIYMGCGDDYKDGYVVVMSAGDIINDINKVEIYEFALWTTIATGDTIEKENEDDEKNKK